MKFICPNCKAKYQIADEKSAGRALRMKCRKCEHMIHIRSGVGGEARVSLSEPPPGPPSAPPRSAEAPAALAKAEADANVSPDLPKAAPAKPAPSPSAPKAAPAKPAPSPAAPKATPAKPALSPGMPKAAAKPLAHKAQTAPHAAKAEPKSPVGPAKPIAGAISAARAAAPTTAPKPAIARAGLPPRPASRVGPPSVRQAAPVVQAPSPKAPEAAPTAAAVSQPAESEAAMAAAPATSSLAGAFSAAVTAPAPERAADIGGDWYVGINGSPVGPVPLSYVRAKAATGAVTLESLVWRDGFEQWQALKNFPELAAIVEESVSSATSSIAPAAAKSAAPLAVPQAPAAPPPAVHAAAADALVAAPAALAPAVLAAPAAVAPAVAPTTGPGVVADRLDLELAGIPRRGTSPAAWIAVVVALFFGLTIGFVVFSNKAPAEPVIKYVEVPAKSAAPAAVPAHTEPAKVADESAVQPESKSASRPAGAKGAAGKPEPGKPLEGLKGLAGLQGSTPAGGPEGSETSAARSGEPLDSSSVQRTVSRYTSSVKRSCWQPALDTRDKDAPTSARVSVAITVGPSGSVQDVSTSGDPRGYRGLASCIASRVRSWQFPASNGATTVNVPFVFAAQ